MFNNVLIAEDYESASISVRKTLEDIGVPRMDYVYYCDDALLRIQKALQSNDPYELLITDLYFEEDYRPQQLSGGTALVTAARRLQPDLKILVFSAEQKAVVIDSLFAEHHVNGFVRKARHDAQELKVALERISRGKQHFPLHLRQSIRQKNAHQFSDVDIAILKQLSQGMLQKDIPVYLQERQLKPAGLSSVEKRLNQMKEAYSFSKNEQLVAFCKDAGII